MTGNSVQTFVLYSDRADNNERKQTQICKKRYKVNDMIKHEFYMIHISVEISLQCKIFIHQFIHSVVKVASFTFIAF